MLVPPRQPGALPYRLRPLRQTGCGPTGPTVLFLTVEDVGPIVVDAAVFKEEVAVAVAGRELEMEGRLLRHPDEVAVGSVGGLPLGDRPGSRAGFVVELAYEGAVREELDGEVARREAQAIRNLARW